MFPKAQGGNALTCIYITVFGRRQENTLSVIQSIHEVGVDQRDETVTTQQPSYVTSEQVPRDVAAERRLGWSSACGTLHWVRC